MNNHRILRLIVAVVLLVTLQSIGHGQATATSADLQTRLRERYDIVALQQGVALVPRESGSTVRMIQIVGGVVTVDGESPTGAQLRDRLGPDADLVLQVSYLSQPQQRALAGGVADTPVSAPQAPTAPAIERTEVTRGDRVRFGESLRVEANERVEGDVAVFGGSAEVDGEVTGDIAVFGGSLRLGPQGMVRGDVSVMGGSLDRAPGAQILGSINEMGRGRGAFRRGMGFSNMFGSFWSRLGSLTATVLRLGLLWLLGLIIVAFGRGPIERIAAHTAAAPLRSGLAGVLAQILFLPVVILTIVVLAVSIVGIPLLVLVPFAVLAVMLVMLVGFIGLAYQIGRWLTTRLGWNEGRAYLAVAIGVVAIGAVTLLAKLAAFGGGFFVWMPLTALGYVVEYLAWAVGFGGAILAWYETQTRFGSHRPTVTPPPAPSEA